MLVLLDLFNNEKEYWIYVLGSPHGVMAKVLNYGLEISEFELKSCYYICFWIPLGKVWTTYSLSYGLNCITGFVIK